MARLTVQEPGLTGAEITTAAAAADGDEFINTGHEMVKAVNGSGADIDITVEADRACNYGTTHSNVTTVTAGDTFIFGPFPREWFASIVEMTYESETDLEVGVFKCG